jgi:hypothetical protein
MQLFRQHGTAINIRQLILVVTAQLTTELPTRYIYQSANPLQNCQLATSISQPTHYKTANSSCPGQAANFSPADQSGYLPIKPA